MIFEALQSELFRFKFHSLDSKILKFPEFNLLMEQNPQVFSTHKDSELVASQNDFLASRLQKSFIYENSYSPDVFIRRLPGLSEPSLQQLWQQADILDCNEMTDSTILVIISKPDFDLTQDDLERAKLNLENGHSLVIFKDDKNHEIGIVVRSSIACNDEDFLSQRDKANQQILKQKTPVEWLSWYKNMSGWFPICIFKLKNQYSIFL